jgi:TfoX/Sxy family transcriptional regulator of competence genes
MAYDQLIADEVRTAIGPHARLSEREMFGGIVFMVNGNMAVGVSREELMVRVGKDAHDEAISRPGARTFDMAGRPMRGWVGVTRDGFSTEEDLASWVEWGVSFAESLPPK